VNFDSWNYVGITITNDGVHGVLTYYINGQPVGNTSIASANISSCYLANLTIGYDQRANGGWYKGAIGQVSFWEQHHCHKVISQIIIKLPIPITIPRLDLDTRTQIKMDSSALQ
jgi:hypothetical protein